MDKIDTQRNYDALRFCPRCGAELGEEEVRGHRRLRCRSCRYVLYLSPAPVTCSLVEDDGRLLLVRRRYPPAEGMWCLPSGFIESGEAPAESARREVLEETGIEIEITGVLETWATTEDPRTPVVAVVFSATKAGGELRAGDDASEARFFAADALPDEIAFTTHRGAIDRHFLGPRGLW